MPRLTPGCKHEELDVDRLRKHASLYSTECVYETAELAGMEALELGRLARGLSEVEARWRLDRDQQARLAKRLLALDVGEEEIRHFTGMTRVALESLKDTSASPLSRSLAPRSRNKSRSRPNPRRCGNDACGGRFDGKRMDARFCSKACKQAVHRGEPLPRIGEITSASRPNQQFRRYSSLRLSAATIAL